MSEDFIAPLLGVIVGGAITTIGTIVVERRREKREEKREAQGEARAVRQAGRLIHRELVEIHLDLTRAVEHKGWWERPKLVFDTPHWAQYREALAASDMEAEKWDSLADAYNAVDKLNRVIQRNIKDRKLTRAPVITLEFSKESLNLATNTDAAVTQGIDALKAFIETPRDS